MIHYLKNKFFSVYARIISSIAFYPTVIAFGFIVLAATLLAIEDDKMTSFLIENLPFLVIDNAETARSVLSTLISGIISLTVFSFSMVMVLLNQASSNYSPRLLPGLISDKRNQIVLGFYIGTIIYNIIVLISILPSGNEYTLNGFSILFGIVLGIVCLGLFVFFIHAISSSIQINNILDEIYRKTKTRLHQLIEMDRMESEDERDDSEWKIINTKKVGYFQDVNVDALKDLIEKHKIHIKILAFRGTYLQLNAPLFKISETIEEEAKNELLECVIISNTISITNNYVLGIKQITEVALKSMSPAINDPGTAIITVDYMTELLALRMRTRDREVYKTENDYTVELTTIDFEDLIYQVMVAYRQYCKHDITMMEKLILMITYLINQPCDIDNYRFKLQEQLDILKTDVVQNIDNPADKVKLYNLM